MSKEFWNEFQSLLVEPKSIQIEYRLHYNSDGEIYLGTTHDHPVDTQYVVVTQTEYDNYFNYSVENKQLKKISRVVENCVQLKKSNKGIAVVAGHASLIIEPNETYQEVEYYEPNN